MFPKRANNQQITLCDRLAVLYDELFLITFPVQLYRCCLSRYTELSGTLLSTKQHQAAIDYKMYRNRVNAFHYSNAALTVLFVHLTNIDEWHHANRKKCSVRVLQTYPQLWLCSHKVISDPWPEWRQGSIGGPQRSIKGVQHHIK